MKRIYKGLILAAGLSSRMGENKLLMDLRGKPLIFHTIDNMLNGGVDEITIVLGNKAEEIREVLASKYGDKLRFVFNENYKNLEMIDSIKEGISNIGSCYGVFLIPGDMPAISEKSYKTIIEKDNEHNLVVFPLYKQYRKHPPLIKSDCIPLILNYEGDNGLRGFWSYIENSIQCVQVDDEGANLDVDTPEDLNVLLDYLMTDK
ncbi:nucleotidyltransferase family protein [Miniphocaeibacter halophilus]|uniref:Nucleotidyltransferase family protein n=1 Tax=Miniphocaeibacter halophilus TaxID=2931922 RepID=A0AC61MPG7_9FIRM|nr:nucleotidyltransferase family protein [Miniphocaeibacter halophilus]QQK07401.1 nucleotidyltransferase family protein [Miniphocaeibacter halophilus]